jgi:hypothetical protein
MTIITNDDALEDLLKNMPHFPATITGVVYSVSKPLVSWVDFKYDNSEIIGQITLPNFYIDYFAKECIDESAWKLKDTKILVYTPNIESGKIYAIKSVPRVPSDEEILFESRFNEFKEKHKDLFK